MHVLLIRMGPGVCVSGGRRRLRQTCGVDSRSHHRRRERCSKLHYTTPGSRKDLISRELFSRSRVIETLQYMFTKLSSEVGNNYCRDSDRRPSTTTVNIECEPQEITDRDTHLRL